MKLDKSKVKVLTKKASEVRIGDSLIDENGKHHRVRAVNKGVAAGTLLFSWTGGWASVGKNTLVEVIDRSPV
jgi:hypothetical protein